VNIVKVENAGFTLLEAVVSLAVFVVIELALFALWGVGLRSFDTAEAQAVVNQELRKSMDSFIEDVSEAGLATLGGIPPDDAWHSSMTFRTPAGVVGGTVQWSNDITYSLGGQNNTQLRRVTGNQTRIIANDVVVFRARRLLASPNMVECEIRCRRTPHSVPPVESMLAVRVKVHN
jgi:Tfp pilus assembly protein PilV